MVKKVKVLSISETIKLLDVGEEIVMTFRESNYMNVMNCARRVGKSLGRMYTVRCNDERTGTSVKRIA